MDNQHFAQCVEDLLDHVQVVLIDKGAEYADENPDRLVAFKTGAQLLGMTPLAYCAALMAKHAVSVHEMATSGKSFDISKWDEKIGDNLNYLLLMRALIIEEQEKRTVPNLVASDQKDFVTHA